MTFQAKPTTKLSKLMKAYCERQVVDYASVVFSYDGQRIREDQTPGEVRSIPTAKFRLLSALSLAGTLADTLKCL